MGLKGFYPWLGKKRGYNPTPRHPLHHPLPDGAKVRVDVLTFFNKIRGINIKHVDDKKMVHAILFKHLKKFGDPSRMVFYVDGAPALEKTETHRERDEKRVKALRTAEVAVETLSHRVSQGQPPTKQMFKNVEKGLRGGFKWSLRDRKDFVEFLQRQRLDARLCRTEADVAIAADCQLQDIVLSHDSDFFAYDTVKTIWRPVGKWDQIKVLEYIRDAVLAQTELSTTKLTALACVSSNDQNKNILSLGIATNYRIIKDLPDADVPSLVKEYLESPRVFCNNLDLIDFTTSILVFTTMTQEIADPAGVSSLPSPSSQPATPLTVSPASSLSYEPLRQQYKLVKDQHARAKARKNETILSSKSELKPDRQGNHRGFRRHRVIDRPAHQPGVSRQVHRPRYSYKARPEPQQHEKPSICKQYQWKPYTAEQETRHRQSIAEARNKETEKKRQRELRRLQREMELTKKPPRKIDEMDKMQLVNAMAWEHPLVSLTVGTVNANSGRAAAAATTDANQLLSSEQQQQLQQKEVSACILQIVEQARVTKRRAQEFLGAFIETVFNRGPTEDDRAILSSLCPAVESKLRVAPQPNQDSQASSSSSAGTPAEDDGEEDAEDDGDEDAEPSAMDKPFIAFYQILLAHIYSRKIKSKTVAERQVGQLLARATSLGITFPPAPPRNVSYPTNALLESTTKQLYRSIKMMYRNGSVALEKKINSQADGQSGTALPKIDPKLPAIENYMLLNEASGGTRRIAPLSPVARRYVGFSERQLISFWQWPTLKDKIRCMMIEDGYFQDLTIVPAQSDALNWIAQIKMCPPGRIITTFLSDVGLPHAKGGKGFRKATSTLDEACMRSHLGVLRNPAFDPKAWAQKGYVIKGSIRTDGRLLQLLAFKIKELQSVRFYRVPEGKLPNPLITTIGGTNRYLTEAQNVFKTTADVEKLLATDPDQVTVLSLDMGTSCVVGATVSLPPGQTPATLKRPEGENKGKNKKTRRGKRKPGTRKRRTAKFKALQLTKKNRRTQTKYFDLVVKRKAVSQPTDNFAKWLENQKEKTIGAFTGKSISDLESALPPLRGEGSSFSEYVKARQKAEADLDKFYNNTNYWKHAWDSKLSRQEEFSKVANGLLQMVGGSIGQPRMEHQKVVIAIGLAKFTATHGPPALHGSFEAFFINTVRSLGYLVIGINEYYSSKRCPTCNSFVSQTSEWRALYCHTCKRIRQRDVMASENMNVAIKGQLKDLQRPLYLQPRRPDGSYPWAKTGAVGGGVLEGGLAGSAIAGGCTDRCSTMSSGSTASKRRTSDAPAGRQTRQRPSSTAAVTIWQT